MSELQEQCETCGEKGKVLTTEMVRTNFAFGKKFPAEYQEVMMCPDCNQVYQYKQKWAKVFAIFALIIIFGLMGVYFFILYSPIIF